MSEAKEKTEFPLATILGGQEGHEIRNNGDYQALTYTSGGDIKYHENQDSVYANAEKGVIAVVDGIGGHGGGKSASMAATTAINDGVMDNASTEAIIVEAKARIQELPESNPGVTLAIVRTVESDDKYYLECTTIGDAQIVVIHPQKGILYVSKDQSKVQWLLDSGDLTDPFEKYTHKDNNLVSNAILKIGETKPPEKTILEVEKGTYAIAITDGIADFVSPEEIAEIVQQNGKDSPIKLKELAESRHWQSQGFQIKINGQMRRAFSTNINHGDNIAIAMMIVGGENPATSVPKSFAVAKPLKPETESLHGDVNEYFRRIANVVPQQTPENQLRANIENIYPNASMICLQFGLNQLLRVVLIKDQGRLQIDLRQIGGHMIYLNQGEEIVLGREDLGGDQRVSRKHVKIKYLPDDSISVTDLGSSNGTFDIPISKS